MSNNQCVFDTDDHVLSITGWFYPDNEYDAIEIYYNCEYLGNAIIGIERPDVWRNFKDDNSLYTGFRMKKNQFEPVGDDRVLMFVIKKAGKIISYKMYEFVYCTYEMKLQKFINNKHMQEKFKQKDNQIVFDADKDNIETILMSESNVYIVSGDKWFSACRQMKKMGMKIMVDYIPIWYYYFVEDSLVRLDWLYEYITKETLFEYLICLKEIKKLALIYGNCQSYKIGEYLSAEEAFTKEYFVIRIPAVCRIKDWNNILRVQLHYMDLFIYQNVGIANKWGYWLNSDYLLTALSESCVKICISNMFFSGYWPQYKGSLLFNRSENEQIFYDYGDSNIHLEWQNQRKLKDIIDVLLDEDYYNREDFENNAKNSLHELKKREERCDLKISDFIADNYIKQKLFYTVNHPTHCLYCEFIRRLLKLLKMNVGGNIKPILPQNGVEIPIYPSVERYLEFVQGSIYFDSVKYHEESKLSKREWMEKYIDVVYGER